MDGAAWPYASLVLVAVDHDLAPILLLSDLAEHTKAIAADSRVSLLFDGTAGLDQPLTGPRVSLLGRAARTDDERLKRRFLAHHPDAEMYAGFNDFQLLPRGARTRPPGGRLRQDPLVRPWPSSCPTPPSDALAESETEIVDHMNADHRDAIQLYAEQAARPCRPATGR